MLSLLNHSPCRIIIENFPNKSFFEHNLVVAIISVMLTLITQYFHNSKTEKKKNNKQVLSIVNNTLNASLESFIHYYKNNFSDAFSLLDFISENQVSMVQSGATLEALEKDFLEKKLNFFLLKTSDTLHSYEIQYQSMKNELNTMKKYFNVRSHYSNMIDEAIKELDHLTETTANVRLILSMNQERILDFLLSETEERPQALDKLELILKPTYEEMFPAIFKLISETQQLKYKD